jgi:hypothetical protein
MQSDNASLQKPFKENGFLNAPALLLKFHAGTTPSSLHGAGGRVGYGRPPLPNHSAVQYFYRQLGKFA